MAKENNMVTNNTPRATSFVIVSGPKGSRRVNLTTGKVRANTVWAPMGAFMAAVNMVGLPCQVTVAGVPSRFSVVGGVVAVTTKAKAIHGVGHSVNGRTKYSRTQVASHY